MRVTKKCCTETGRRFRDERFRRGMDQREFATLFGVTKATVSNWERGYASNIALKMLELLRIWRP